MKRKMMWFSVLVTLAGVAALVLCNSAWAGDNNLVSYNIQGIWDGTVSMGELFSNFGVAHEADQLSFLIGNTDKIENWYDCENGQRCMYYRYIAGLQAFWKKDRLMQNPLGDGNVEFYPSSNVNNVNVASLNFVIGGWEYSGRIIFSPVKIVGKFLAEFWKTGDDGITTVELITGDISFKKR